jgi:hypothetical protein
VPSAHWLIHLWRLSLFIISCPFSLLTTRTPSHAHARTPAPSKKVEAVRARIDDKGDYWLASDEALSRDETVLVAAELVRVYFAEQPEPLVVEPEALAVAIDTCVDRARAHTHTHARARAHTHTHSTAQHSTIACVMLICVLLVWFACCATRPPHLLDSCTLLTLAAVLATHIACKGTVLDQSSQKSSPRW